ncbi:MAG: hypothetical protein IKX38_03910 [Bacteroidales bacterium]|nr:hypothetical protein [Bacteroidales bacterium]
MKRIIFTAALFLIFQIAYSQDNTAIYLMKNNTENLAFNPANPVNRNYINIPMLGNFSVTGRMPFSFNDLFRKNDDNTFTVTPRNMYNVLKENNVISASVNEKIIGFGFGVKNTYLDFGLSFKTDVNMLIPKELVGLIVNGNAYYADKNETLVLDNMYVNLNSYAEFGVGVQQTFGEKLRVGVRPKFLLGLANVETKRLNATFYTSPEYDSIWVKEDILLESSCLYDYVNNTGIGKFYDNRGLAFDLGVTYQINDHFSVGASVLDLGVIWWNSNNYEYKADGEVTFSGIELDVLQQNLVFQGELDSLAKILNIKTEEIPQYTTHTNTKVLLQGNYDINDIHRISASARLDFIESQVNPYFSAAYVCNPARWFEVVANAYYYRQMFNLGTALGFSLGPFYLNLSVATLLNVNRLENVKAFSGGIGMSFIW